MLVVQGLINQTLPTWGMAGTSGAVITPIYGHEVSLSQNINMAVSSIEMRTFEFSSIDTIKLELASSEIFTQILTSDEEITQEIRVII